MTDTKETINEGQQVIMPVYNRFPIVFDHGEGSYLYDTDGKKYLDFVAGIAVNALGYNDAGLKQTIADQCSKIMHVSNLYWTQPAVDAAETLTKAAGMDEVFFTNSGAEAIEASLKLARIWSKLHKGKEAVEIITMHNSFHGRTYAAVTATGQEKYHKNLEPLMPGIISIDFNDFKALKDTVSDKTCAILLEPVQGEGGIIPADSEYLKKIRALCDQENILLIFDEVQCGAGRTGSFLASMDDDVKADIVCMAKGIGAGFPVGACLAKSDVASAFTPGTHGSTYGGNPLACAVVNHVVGRTSKPEFLAQVKENGAYFKAGLEKLKEKYSVVADVRGRGLILGLQLNEALPAGDVIAECMRNGLLLVAAGSNTIRFVPPLTVSKEEIDEGLSILENAIKFLKN